jgi:hypothetical protein
MRRRRCQNFQMIDAWRDRALTPGFNHLPWWFKDIGDLVGGNSGNFFYVRGTSMATPHTAAAVAAMMMRRTRRSLRRRWRTF